MLRVQRRLRLVCCAMWLAAPWPSLAAPPQETGPAEQASLFHDQVLNVLERRCFSCHSHSGGTMEGGLALDWRSGWELGGSRGPAIVPGDANSLLLRAVRHTDPALQMPEEKLPAAEIAVLEQWIASGAFDDRAAAPLEASPAISNDWWSLRPLAPSAPPAGAASRGAANHPIDAFLLQRIAAAGLESSSQADRRTLIRRLSYDLTGLPPSPEQVDAFVRNEDPAAWDRVVDELLDSPHYGERWARHWMDTIHFADSHGFEHDVGRDHAWRYRDYLIAAFNRDVPWDRFIREQIAADEFYPEETQLRPALGFLGAGTFDMSTYSTAPVTSEYLERDDLLTQTMAAFVSTTANCARCHAHKFDPISQEDYYALQAVFAGVLKGDVPYDEDPAVARRRAELQRLIAAADARDADVLLAAEYAPIVETRLRELDGGAQWRPVELETLLSTDGAVLSQQPDGAILASGPAPERDTYVLTAVPPAKRITALRLDVLAHESLPSQGPGRAGNGNFHLSEVAVHVFEPGAPSGRRVAISRATADFSQTDWTIDAAIDGAPATAWGIHPQEGQPHHAVFELTEPLSAAPGAKAAVTLRQVHGGAHVIGAFRLSATEGDPERALAIPNDVAEVLDVPAAERTSEQQLAAAAFVLKQHAVVETAKLPAQSLVYAAGPSVAIPAGRGASQAASSPAPKVVHVLRRGDFGQPGAVAEPGALSALTHLPARFLLAEPQREATRRAALADWLAHRDNVLTWRSVVNRVWHYHFGRGLCDSPSDFGRMGGIPSHPELLDWLAVWFRDEARGSLKALHRLIVTSAAYRQSSREQAAAVAIDGDNRLLWRQNRQRLDADGFRDFVLAASGTLDLTMGGPAVQHFRQSPGPQSTPVLDYAAYDWTSPGAGRRSIYRCVWRGIPDPLMEALDFPDLGLLAPTRGFSASSLQALALYNSDFVLHHSRVMAQRLEIECPDAAAQATEAARRTWLRSPDDDEACALQEFAREFGLPALCRVLLNSNEFLFID